MTTDSKRELVVWHGPSGAWYSPALISFGLAGLAYLPLIHAILGGRLADVSGSGRLVAILVLSIIALLTGVAVAIYPRPKPTELGYVRETVIRCARGAVCGIALAWSVFTFVDGSAFGNAPFANEWLVVATQLAGLIIVALLWDPAQKRILRAWFETVKGYSMSATGAAQ